MAGEGWSVRRSERGVTKNVEVRRKEDPFIQDVEERLRFKFKTKVNIVRKGRFGHVQIAFSGSDELIRITDILLGGKNGKSGRT